MVFLCTLSKMTGGRGTDTLPLTPPRPQVQVGSTPQDQRIVGYIACTHLHAPPGRSQAMVFWGWDQCLGPGWAPHELPHPVSVCPAEDSAIRCEQLDLLQDWLADFRKSTSSSSAANPEELVAFDVICGDLNFDNCSSGEAPPQSGLQLWAAQGVGSSHSQKDLS